MRAERVDGGRDRQAHDVDEAIVLSDRILVMSQGPAATILRDVPVEFTRPRSPDVLNRDPSYYELRASLLAALTVPLQPA